MAQFKHTERLSDTGDECHRAARPFVFYLRHRTLNFAVRPGRWFRQQFRSRKIRCKMLVRRLNFRPIERAVGHGTLKPARKHGTERGQPAPGC